jgi:hypothetical protein
MTNPFDPAFDPDAIPEPDTWVTVSQAVLVFCGVSYLLIGVLGGLGMGLAFSMDPTIDPALGVPFGIGFGVMMFLMGAFFGGLNFVAAWGLKSRAKWAWIMTLVLGAIYAPSGCMPLGMLLLFGMLNDKTRKNFGMG